MRYYLYPFALLYGMVVIIRNILYDYGIFKSKSFRLPVISVGNISVGGTGKTPHMEYLVRLLSPSNNVCTLSRGYGRKSKGFILGDLTHSASEIGDEPCQLKQKFPSILVAVDEKRRRGIQNVLRLHPATDVILLDDAFQHRAVDAGLKIVLTDYHRLFTTDRILPVGNLREPKSGFRRANILIVSKTPQVLSPIERRMITDSIKPETYQQLFFTYITYGEPVALFESCPAAPVKPSSALLVEGIANSYPLEDYLKRKLIHLDTLHYPDHYQYKLKDVQKIRDDFTNIVGRNKVIFTTEKDAMRLKTAEFSAVFHGLPIYYIPIEVRFHGDEQNEFDNLILGYVEENKRYG